ncbi:hypothetical protein [Halorarum halobium]|uniref:hypothetical protein n=1 Tax=Halorarum halobium TaxID=3075121 RepID=UPI0028B1CB02|nr:hypothetical protein [Halobaculum sp. XH14]
MTDVDGERCGDSQGGKAAERADDGDGGVGDGPTVPSVLARHVPAVAAERGLDGGTVRTAAARLHESVTTYPGVTDLVFEYRRSFSHDPLVAREGDVHYLLVPPRVWPEFGAAIDGGDAELAALRALHERAFDAGTDVVDRGDWEPLVLVGQSVPR